MADSMLGMEEVKSETLRESRSGDKDGADRAWRCNEKLALMHAVLKHGDQAWTAQEERNQVLFTPRRCAEVHAELVETDPKKLKRTGPVGDDVLKAVAERFAGERITELKRSIKERERLAKNYAKDIAMINAGKMDAQLQAIINEPMPNQSQTALALQSPPEKKRASKKSRVEPNAEAAAATPSIDAPPTPAAATTPLSSSTKDLSASQSSISLPKAAVPPLPSSLASSASEQPSAPTPMDVIPAPATPVHSTHSALLSLPSVAAAPSPAPSVHRRLSTSSNSTPLAASGSGDKLTPEEAMRKQREPLLRVLSSMERRGPHAQFFQEPVPLEDAPEYDQVVKQRMDFNQVRKRVETFAVYGIWEFYRDMLLIFTNALTYNEPGSFIYTVAGQMKRALEKEMEPLLAEARGKAPPHAEEKEGTTRRSARVKEERKWHDD